MADLMTPEKTDFNAAERNATLMRIAKACKQQGQFHLACKKYTQAGDRVKAMKALMKSRDTEKVIYYAGKRGGRSQKLLVCTDHACCHDTRGRGSLIFPTS